MTTNLAVVTASGKMRVAFCNLFFSETNSGKWKRSFTTYDLRDFATKQIGPESDRGNFDVRVWIDFTVYGVHITKWKSNRERKFYGTKSLQNLQVTEKVMHLSHEHQMLQSTKSLPQRYRFNANPASAKSTFLCMADVGKVNVIPIAVS